MKKSKDPLAMTSREKSLAEVMGVKYVFIEEDYDENIFYGNIAPKKCTCEINIGYSYCRCDRSDRLRNYDLSKLKRIYTGDSYLPLEEFPGCCGVGLADSATMFLNALDRPLSGLKLNKAVARELNLLVSTFKTIILTVTDEQKTILRRLRKDFPEFKLVASGGSGHGGKYNINTFIWSEPA